MNTPSEHLIGSTITQGTIAFHGVRYLVADVQHLIRFRFAEPSSTGSPSGMSHRRARITK
jgi:hypothetical protein